MHNKLKVLEQEKASLVRVALMNPAEQRDA